MNEIGMKGLGMKRSGIEDGGMSRDDANALRCRPGVTAGFYEVYCLMISAPASDFGAWIRYVVQAPERPEDAWCELWATVFDDGGGESFGLMREYDLTALEAQRSPFLLRLGEGRLQSGALSGVLDGRGHRISWDLSLASGRSPYLPFPEELYKGDHLPVGYLSPYHDGRFDGWIEVDGRRVEIEEATGEQMHLWGRKHPPRIHWAHCSSFDGVENVELGLHAAPQVDDSSPPPVHLAYLRAGDRSYQLLSVTDGSTATHEAGLGFWRFEAESETLRIEAEISGDPALLVEAEYREPDGSPWWAVHNDLCSSTVELSTREAAGAPWRSEARLHSTGTTQGEWGADQPDPGVRNKVLRI